MPHPGRVPILGGPAGKQFRAFLPHFRVRQRRRAAETQALEQGFVCEGPLEARTGILDEAVEDVQGTELTVKVSVLELLPDGTGGLGGARVLEINDFDEIRDAAEVIDGHRLTRESLNRHCHCRVRLLLSDALARLPERGRMRIPGRT